VQLAFETCLSISTVFRRHELAEKAATLNKADPFGDMKAASDFTSADGAEHDPSAAQSEEPIKADSVGALLCATRMRMGKDLQDIAKILRIKYSYLVAIEDGRYEDLPGSAYSVGFVRAYADYLELDGNEVVKRLRVETNGSVTKAKFDFPVPNSESGLPNGGLLAISVAMGVLVYGSWYVVTNNERDAADLIQEMPSRIAVLIEDDTAQVESIAPGLAVDNSTDETPLVSSPAVDEPQALSEAPSESSEVIANIDISALEPSEEPELITDAQNGVEPEGQIETPVVADITEQQVTESPLPVEATDQEDLEVEIAAVAPTLSEEAVESGLENLPNEAEAQNNNTSDAEETELERVSEQLTANVESPEVLEPQEAPGYGVSEDVIVDVAKVEAEISESSETTVMSSLETPAVTDPAEVEQLENIEEQIEPVQPEPQEEGPSLVTSIDDVRQTIELRAKSDSWIQVRDGNELLLTRLLREGEVYQVPDREGLTLMTGNAGGLEVFVGGEQMPPLGDEGVVRRGVPLSPENLKSGAKPG